MKVAAVLSAMAIVVACAAATPTIDLTANNGVNERVRDFVDREVCVAGVLFVDSAHGSHYALPRTHSTDVISVYGDRITVPLRANEALERGLSLGENQHKSCGILVNTIPNQNGYRLEPRQ